MSGTAPGFGTDGVRGLANQELTPDVALALGRAAVEILDAKHVVVGRDPRRSGPMLEAALVAGVCSAGADVELLGVVPTPTVAWAATDRSCPGAMISASHNPFADNGIKLFAPGGLKLSDALESRIEQRYLEYLDGGSHPGPTGADTGTIRASTGVDGWLELVTGSIGPRRLDGLSVVIDCANGAAFELGPRVFANLGATVHVLGNEPDGVNINEGYGSTDTARLSAAVKRHGADAGLALDGDADRLIAIDEAGTVVDGDRVLAILAADWSRQGALALNTVVVTVMTNLGFHLAMQRLGINVISTGVGDRYVLEALEKDDLSLGGEQSGHVICRNVATTGDGILTGVQLLDVVARTEEPLSKMAAEAMTTVPQILRNVRLPARDPSLIDRMADDIATVEAQLGDDGRVLVRASGTEPLLRIMVEHIDPETADRTCDQLVSVAERLVSNHSPGR